MGKSPLFPWLRHTHQHGLVFTPSRTGYFPLFGSGQYLTRTSHPSGSRPCMKGCEAQRPVGISKRSNLLIVQIRPLSAARTQKIIGPMPSPGGCITNLVVLNQPLYGLRQRRTRMRNDRQLIIYGCSRYQSSLMDVCQPLSWFTAAPRLMHEKASLDHRAPDPA